MDNLAYSISEAVKVCGGALSRTSLYRAIQRGEITLHKNGKRSIVLADDLRKWVQSLPTSKHNAA